MNKEKTNGLVEALKEEYLQLCEKIAKAEFACVTLEIDDKAYDLLNEQIDNMRFYADSLMERAEHAAGNSKRDNKVRLGAVVKYTAQEFEDRVNQRFERHLRVQKKLSESASFDVADELKLISQRTLEHIKHLKEKGIEIKPRNNDVAGDRKFYGGLGHREMERQRKRKLK